MKRFVKICAYLVAGLIVLVAGAAIVVPMVVDPNDYREEIALQVEQRTGRKVDIAGGLKMTVVPWLGVETGSISMSNAEGMGSEPFVSLDSAQVRVKLIPLLSREVEMDTVVVRGLTVNLTRDAQGRSNWEDLAGSAAAGGDAGSSPTALAAFALGGVVLENAAVSFIDAVSNSTTQISNLTTRTGAISLGDAIPAELSFDFVHTAGNDTIKGSAKGSTRVSAQIGQRRLQLQDLSMTVSADAPAIAAGTLSGKLEGELNYDDEARQITGHDLVLALDMPPLEAAGFGPIKIGASGDLDLRLEENTLAIPKLTLSIPSLSRQDMSASLEASTSLAVNLSSQRLALKGLQASGGITRGAAGSTATPYQLAGDVTVDLAAQSADVNTLQVSFGDLNASGEIKVRQLLSAQRQLSGSIDTAPFQARKLLTSAGITLPPMRDDTALGEASIKTGFKLEGQALELSPLLLKVDGATLKGSVASPDLSRHALRFDVQADRLNVDRYLPPGQAAAPPSAAGAIPVAWLRGLDVNGKLAVGTLRYSGLDLSNVALGIKAQEQKLTLSPLSAKLAGGSYAGNISVDGSKARPVIYIDEKLSGMDLDSVLRALGVRGMRIDLRGGRSDVALKATLTSSADGKQVSARGVTFKAKLGGRSLPGGSLPLGFKGNLDADLAASTLRLSSMDASISNLKARGEVQIASFNTTPRYSANLQVPKFNLRTLARRFGLPVPRTASKKTFTSVAFDGELKGDGNSIDAGPMTLTMDRSTMTGSAGIKNFLAPAIAFNLKMDRLNADSYLPPQAKGKAATPGAAATVLPVDLVRALNMNGTLTVKSLQVSGLQLNGVTFTAKAANGELTLSPLGASLYGGRYDGNVRFDARNTQPRVHLDETISGVNMGQLLTALRGDSPVTGTADLRAKLTASGRDTDALLRTLDGDVGFDIKNGTLRRIDVVNSMCGALGTIDFDQINKKTLAAGLASLLLSATAKGNQGAAGQAGGDTRFTSLKGNAHITKGVARNEDLQLASPIVRVTGAGTVNLPSDSIDYRANAELVQACAGIGKRDLAGHMIPVRITGSLRDPKVSPTIPVGLIQAIRRKRRPAPAPAAAVQPTPAVVQPTPAAPPAQQTAQQKPGDMKEALEDAGEKLLKGFLGNILKQ